MVSNSTVHTNSRPHGWATRWFRGFSPFRNSASDHTEHLRRLELERELVTDPATRELKAATLRLIADERYALVLLKEAVDSVREDNAAAGWEAIDSQMALVPAGSVPVVRSDGSTEQAELAAFYLDRHAVTNRQFHRFVQAGCYDALEIWPREIWPGLLRFTDRTGLPGPKNWERGNYPSGMADHPVVGVCWYEALAYSRWVGKRLPAAAEWQKAAGWPEHMSGGTCNRYPWGDLYAEGRANLWASGLGKTAPVESFREGATLNGIHQMSGNVWEWLEDPLDAIPCHADESFQVWKPLRRIVGGAFDTYLPGEATNQFVTGQPELDRRSNIGFRCAVSLDRLRPPTLRNDPHARSNGR